MDLERDLPSSSMELDLSSVELGAILSTAHSMTDLLPTPQCPRHSCGGVGDMISPAWRICNPSGPATGPGAQVLHDQLVASSLAGRVALPSHRTCHSRTTAAAGSGNPSMLHLDPTLEPGAVQILDRVLGISHVIKLAKPKVPLLVPLDDHVPILPYP